MDMDGEGGLMVAVVRYLNIRCLALEVSAVQIARIHLVFGSIIIIASVHVAIRTFAGSCDFQSRPPLPLI
jgi:hypothetical protein